MIENTMGKGAIVLYEQFLLSERLVLKTYNNKGLSPKWFTASILWAWTFIHVVQKQAAPKHIRIFSSLK